MFNFDLDWSVLNIWSHLPAQLEKGQILSKNFEGGRTSRVEKAHWRGRKERQYYVIKIFQYHVHTSFNLKLKILYNGNYIICIGQLKGIINSFNKFDESNNLK
jgi:hypothetical protein